jgi:prepilin-type N-terminal cleavage/methylation domain-containing protein
MLTSTSRARRAGFTLTELVISMTLLALIGSSIVAVIISQQRFYRGTNQLTDTRSQLRQIATVLPSDLRGISGTGGDVYFMSDSAIEFRSTFGSSVVCKLITSAPASIVLPPRTTIKGARWTSWSQQPVIGDSIALYDENASTSGTDDRWTMHQITGWTAVTGDVATGCQSTTKFVLAADLTSTNPSFKITVSPAFGTTITQGAAVRFYKRVRYNLYRASDGLWYLGYKDCLTSRTPQCSALQTIGGPYQPYGAPGTGTSGLEFAYYDSLGAVTANRLKIARISLVLRGQSAERVQLGGINSGWTTFRDSLNIEVALRNRK